MEEGGESGQATYLLTTTEQNLSLLQRAIAASGVGAVSKAIASNPQAALALKFMWEAWARPEQTPGKAVDYTGWLYLAGRGSGKTRSGAEWVLERVREGYRRGAFVARTSADVRDTLVEGEAGILAVAPPWNRPVYEPSKRRLVWQEELKSYKGAPAKKKKGCMVTTFTGEEPDQLRGPSHDFAWADELATWQYLEDAWANLMLGLRLYTPTGLEPKYCITTTPRPLKLIREMIEDKSVYISTGTTYDNRENLAPAFYNSIIKRYEGTRLGRQELLAEILDDNPNALFTRDDIDKYRIKYREELPQMQRINIGVDPAVTANEDSSDTGIVTVGQDENDHYYILADNTCHKKPMGWAKEVIKVFNREEADLVVGEVNNGGDLIEAVIRSIPQDLDSGIEIAGEDLPYKTVRATRGKAIRAEPVGALCEQGRLHIVGNFPELEDQMVQYDPETSDVSPDRYDAMVWAVISIMKEPAPRITTM